MKRIEKETWNLIEVWKWEAEEMDILKAWVLDARKIISIINI